MNLYQDSCTCRLRNGEMGLHQFVHSFPISPSQPLCMCDSLILGVNSDSYSLLFRFEGRKKLHTFFQNTYFFLLEYKASHILRMKMNHPEQENVKRQQKLREQRHVSPFWVLTYQTAMLLNNNAASFHYLAISGSRFSSLLYFISGNIGFDRSFC